jgi:ubiquinone/menaquinone biosynthesis C-methylase UbiE
LSPHRDRIRTRYEITAERYDERYSEIQQVKYPMLLSKLLLKSGDRILDWGCGTGLAARALKSAGADCFGVDHALGMLRLAAPRTGPRLALADCARLPFKDRSFNAVLGATVLQNLECPSEALLEISRVLKADGRAALSYPARAAVDLSGIRRAGLDLVGRFSCGEDSGIWVKKACR